MRKSQEIPTRNNEWLCCNYVTLFYVSYVYCVFTLCNQVKNNVSFKNTYGDSGSSEYRMGKGALICEGALSTIPRIPQALWGWIRAHSLPPSTKC